MLEYTFSMLKYEMYLFSKLLVIQLVKEKTNILWCQHRQKYIAEAGFVACAIMPLHLAATLSKTLFGALVAKVIDGILNMSAFKNMKL